MLVQGEELVNNDKDHGKHQFDRSKTLAVLESPLPHTHTLHQTVISVLACPVSMRSMAVIPLNTNFLGHAKL